MSRLLLDAHSHLQLTFSVFAYLDGASKNFSRLPPIRDDSECQGCLFVTDTEKSRASDRLRRFQNRTYSFPSSNWRLTDTAEPASLIGEHNVGTKIVLILGRQLRTTDGFEVLQIGSLARESGSPSDLGTQVPRVLERGGYPVIPWGFGKWTLRRKRILLDCLRAWDPQDVALADSALRPRVLSDHPILSAARERGFTILAGTDPLPLPSHERRSGRFVSALDVELDLDRPWADLRTHLSGAQPAVLGERDSLIRSLWDQARLRIG